MAYRVHFATFTAAAIVTGAVGANAADYIPEPVMEQPVIEYAPTPYYSRVDCAVAFNEESNLRVGDPEVHFVTKNGGRVETDTSWVCGVGFGHYIGEHLRVDATLEYRGEFDVHGIQDPLHTPVPVPEGLNDQLTSVDSIVTLFNAYWDFGEHYGFTPYVGAGIGFAHNEMEDAVTEDGYITHGGENWDFAWALMAGATAPISPDLLFDIGYRYVNFGDVTSSTTGYDPSIPGPVGYTTPVKVADMDAHEIRLGFRYNFY